MPIGPMRLSRIQDQNAVVRLSAACIRIKILVAPIYGVFTVLRHHNTGSVPLVSSPGASVCVALAIEDSRNPIIINCLPLITVHHASHKANNMSRGIMTAEGPSKVCVDVT